jgi:hypothetical protein
MKIAQQKLIGLARSDKNNEVYWKFREFAEEAPVAPNSPPPAKPSTDVSLPTAENTAKVELSQSAEESEQVKKFRAKYGNPNPQKSHGE